MTFASFSTVIAVFENIMSFWLENTSFKRWQVALINIGLIFVLALPAIFSLDLWSNVTVFGLGFLDLEDFIVSNLLLPIGSLMYVVFCTSRYGWGWKKFEAELNAGEGLKFPRKLRFYMTWILPLIIFALLVVTLVGKIAG